MKQILTDFIPGPYVGLVIEAEGDETDFLNALINTVIDGSSYALDEEALSSEAARAEGELREKLTADRKPIGAFCLVAGIDESELREFCKANLVRTALENLTITTIAEAENIQVLPADLAAYKRDYRDQYARMLLTEPDFGDEELMDAILTRKVLNFLKANNTMQRKGA